MNKGIFRLVFSKRLGMYVPASEAARTHGKTATRRLSRRLAALVTAVAAAHAPLALAEPAGLKPQLNAQGALNWSNAAIDAARTSANQMTIRQNAAKAILNWQQLNLARGESLIFDQQGNRSWAALNRIHDANPSLIAGNIKADGHLYFINTNGIIFGEGAQINVGSLTAGSLDITDELFINGILPSDVPVFSGTGGFVQVKGEDFLVFRQEAGKTYWLKNDGTFTEEKKDAKSFASDDEAKAALNAIVAQNPASGAVTAVVREIPTITTASGGRVMLLAPDVENHGVIHTPDGQTILAAGKQVYLAKSDDPAGVLVEVNSGGTATNLGEIIAERGNVTLVGLAVNQQGRISASTSVRANGSIHLLARDTVNAATKDGVTTLTPKRYGTVTVGAGSVTEIGVEIGDKEEVLDKQAFTKSRVKIEGRAITVDGTIQAKGGDVTLDASKLDTVTDGSSLNLLNRVYLGEHALIDVSGVDAAAPMSRNQLEIQLFSEQLKDAPLLRGGPLFGEKIYVDARKGTSLIDTTDSEALIGRTVAEKMSAGGSVAIKASQESTKPGDVVIREGAKVDVSGGTISYSEGYIKESRLRYNGQLISIADATPDKAYEGTAETYSVTDNKWGITRTWTLSQSPQGIYQAAYQDGQAAGKVNVSGWSAVMDGSLIANTQKSFQQRNAPPVGATLTLAINSDLHLVSDAWKLPVDFSSHDILPADRAQETQLEVDFLRNGFTHLDLSASNITVDTPVVLDQGGSYVAIMDNPATTDVEKTPITVKDYVSLKGQVTVNEDITAAGGDIRINTDVFGNTNGGAVTVADGVTLSTAGLFTNDTQGIDGAMTAPVVVDAGNVMISGMVGGMNALTMGSDSLIDASAGAWVSASGELQGGKGGNIDLTGIQSVETGQVRAYGFDQGGALTLNSAQNIQVGGESPATAGTLWLSEGFFNQGGFSKYKIQATAPESDLLIGDVANSRTEIRPQAESLTMRTGYGSKSSGTSMDQVAQHALQPAHLRRPVSVTFKAGDELKVAENTAIVTEAPTSRNGARGDVTLEAGRQLTILGDIVAPAATIRANLTGKFGTIYPYDTTKSSLYIGEKASLSATGHYLTKPAENDLRNAEVLDAGSILLGRSLIKNSNGSTTPVNSEIGALVLAQGSVLDVSGVAGEVDVVRQNGSARETQYGAAGTIEIGSRNALVLDGEMHAKAEGSGKGGTLTLSIAGNSDNTLYQDETDRYPNDPRTLTVTQNTQLRGTGLQADSDMSGVMGQAAVSVEQIQEGGFDRVNLHADMDGVAGDKIVLPSGVNLAVPSALTLESGLIAVTGNGTAQIAAPVVTLQTNDNGGQAPVAGDATLKVAADFIDLVNTVGISGVKSTQLDSTRDIRGRGFTSNVTGSLTVPGELILKARQIYPVTNGSFLFEATGPQSRIEVQQSKLAPTPVLSAGGKLTLKANNIVQGGTLKAPLGFINLDAQASLILTPDSLTSVSAAGQLIPYGWTGLGGTNLYNPVSAIDPNTDSPNGIATAAETQKKIELKSASIDMQAGATVDISGGGDTLAYEWVEGIGGSIDVLGQPGVYAVMPSMKDEYAPYDYSFSQQRVVLDAEKKTYDGIPVDLKPGDAIYLSGIPGLEAGTYTLLPARYALLPGAYMVQTSTAQLPQGASALQADGASLVSGYRTTIASTVNTQAGRDAEYSTYRVINGKVFRESAGTTTYRGASEYILTSGNDFFAAQAEKKGTEVPRIASDAGQLVLNAGSELALEADVKAKKEEGGRGALVDIVSDKISVVSVIGASDGSLQLEADTLNGLNAESLLLGGTRTQDENGMTVATNASSVTFANDKEHALQVTELIAVAKDTVALEQNAVIETVVGTTDGGKLGLHASGDGALLAVSSLHDIEFDRSGTANAKGKLDIASGATVKAHRSMVLDATKEAELNGTASVSTGGSITLGANRILIGQADSTVSGMRIDNTLLGSFGVLSKVTLNSYRNIDFYGQASLGDKDVDLTLNAGGIAGHMGANESVTLTARNLEIRNSAGAVYESVNAAGGSTLNVNAENVALRGGSTATNAAIGGFENVNLTANKEVVFGGSGKTTVNAAETRITSTRITADTGTDYTLSATGTLTTASIPLKEGEEALELPTAEGLGAKLTLAGTETTIGGKIELASGQFTAQATQGDLIVDADANIQAKSLPVKFDKYTEYTPGGSVTLQADLGNVETKAGSVIDVSGGAGDGDAGKVKVSATKGNTILAGKLKGSAAAGKQGGSFTLDTKTISDFSKINSVLNAGSFNASRDMRIRSGDVTIAATDVVKAENVVLSADTGKINVDGTVDASGANGGNIEIYAKDDLTVHQGGKLLAHATGDGTEMVDGLGAGGNVLLSSDSGTVKAEVFEADGTTRMTNAALIDVSGEKDKAGVVKGAAGSVTLRAGRTGTNNDTFNSVRTAGTATALTATITGLTTLTRGTVVAFTPNQNSGTAARLNINGLGAKSLMKDGGTAIVAGDLKKDMTYIAVYDGTNFQLVSGDAMGSLATGSGAVGTGVNIEVDTTAAITGARDVHLEASRIYEKSVLDSKAQLQLAADTQAFASRAATIQAGYRQTMDKVTATLAPAVEVRSTGDLTLSNDWNLDNTVNGTLGMAGAGTLTLRAAKNLNINGSLSDGFDAVTPFANLVAGNAWSFRLASGADLTAANPLATVKNTSGGNLTLANNKLIRTGTGDIEMAAGGNLVMGNDGSVIYTVGQAADTLAGFETVATATLSTKNGSTSASYLTNGGDIGIAVQGDITGKIVSVVNDASKQQLVNEWLFRQGNTKNTDVSWWVRPDLFKQGVAAMGGGNVTIDAGGDITNFSASVPTTGRYDTFTKTVTTDPVTGDAIVTISDGTGKYRIDGGGDLTVRAGGNINSGVYYVGRGDLKLSAGGAITKSANTAGTIVALQDSSASVSALKSATLETVFNPTLFAQSSVNSNITTGLSANSSYFSSYGDESVLSLSSITGDVGLGMGLNSDTKSAIKSSGLNSAATNEAAVLAMQVHPATVKATAFGGSINLGKVTLAPAAQGNLSLLAARDVSAVSGAAITVSDADPDALPNVRKPIVETSNNAFANLKTAMLDLRNGHGAIPIHAGDLNPVAIVARDGSINLLGDNVSKADISGASPGLVSSKAVYARAGQDIVLNAHIQHANQGDISVIDAGRDLKMAAGQRNMRIQVSGGGNLLIKTGRDLDLADTSGVLSVANSTNLALPSEGASITLMAGLGEEGADVATYIATYLAPTGNGPAVLQGDAEKLEKYRQDTRDAVTAYMRKLTNDDSKVAEDGSVVLNGIQIAANWTKYQDAKMAEFLALDADRQAVFAYRHFSSELLASGQSYKDTASHQRGDDAIATMFSGKDYNGDILMYKSQIRTQRGGSIDMLAPGGLINAGLPGDVSQLGHDIGVVTENGGDIHAFSESGFLVNQSKVITQYGGDITVWVNNGDIDAGRGSKTAVSVPEREVETDNDGNTTVEFKGVAAGSGIRAQSYDPDGPTAAGKAPSLGTVSLIAPRGVLNAGEAGIAAGNFLAVATQVLGADNITATGTSSGVPVADTGALSGALAGVSNVASEATKSASDEVARQVAQAAPQQFESQQLMPAFVSVEVIGLGD
ncbi:MAG TPA: filamentous hemagglutinin family protein [Methylophilaceae bacterium]|nr:filamentous hemagglutinin family protein [Methylophilaceae bacterium]